MSGYGEVRLTCANCHETFPGVVFRGDGIAEFQLCNTCQLNGFRAEANWLVQYKRLVLRPLNEKTDGWKAHRKEQLEKTEEERTAAGGRAKGSVSGA